MPELRKIKDLSKSKPTLEGAGVHLKRAFGNYEVPSFDPFLLLDDFHSDNPQDYIAGFPWHPHRGIETVTYMNHGQVRHGDSLGNSGVIQSGDIQWMTAGSGIIHEEMPEQRKSPQDDQRSDEKGDFAKQFRDEPRNYTANDLLWGFQLWVNLPASHKMMRPRYQEIKGNEIPVHDSEEGIRVKVVAGTFRGVTGPVTEIICDPQYLDIQLAPGKRFEHEVKSDHTLFAYILEGQGRFGIADSLAGASSGDDTQSQENLVLFTKGESVAIEAADTPLRFLLISGKPIGEPVAWHGPIVMNTDDELRTAFEEYQKGTFIKDRR
jgi:redox-sensitive bicupin YhaK (pirin superfamily)